MINIADIVTDIRTGVGLWCPATDDTTELARMTDAAVGMGVGMMSVAPSAVTVIWPWLEKQKIKIIPRFYACATSAPDDAEMSGLAIGISAAFRAGASGATVFVPRRRLSAFVDAICVVRDDLFFNKALDIGLDINEIDACDWMDVFEELIRIRADSVTFALTRDLGDKSDFVGRVYGALSSWNTGFAGQIQWMTGANLDRAEQVMRLTADMRPALVSRTRVLVCDV